MIYILISPLLEPGLLAWPRPVYLPAKALMLSCLMSSRMRMHFIRLMPGDKVLVEMSPYDLTKGRVIYRVKR